MLIIKDLHFGYPRKPLLLENINLELRQGHIYGLLGKNGAGKSTLLKNMIGLADPAKGSCQYNAAPVKGRPVKVLEDIYFIAEELYVPSLTPTQFVANTACFYPKFSQPDFYHYLDVLAVDRNGIMDRQSFGQQKKAMIAFGLATHTDLLLMDEPTIRGKAAILANTTGEFSKADVELLFNAIISGNPTLLILLKDIRHEKNI